MRRKKKGLRKRPKPTKKKILTNKLKSIPWGRIVAPLCDAVLSEKPICGLGCVFWPPQKYGSHEKLKTYFQSMISLMYIKAICLILGCIRAQGI